MTGFSDLDKLIGGLSGGQLILVGGRPAMGKSTFAMNIADHVLRQGKNGVVVFNIEMAEDQYIRRCMELGLGTGQRESLHIVEQIPETTPEDGRNKEKTACFAGENDYRACGDRLSSVDGLWRKEKYRRFPM